MGIAEEAGVTRATVYRHFPDEASLFQACSSHWLAGQVPPDPARWAERDDPRERLVVGLGDLYRFFCAGESMLRRVYRDKEALPEEHRKGLDAREAAMRDLQLSAFPERQRVRPQLRAAVGHAVSFWTWRSLCVDHGLTDHEAVGLMVGLAEAAATGS